MEDTKKRKIEEQPHNSGAFKLADNVDILKYKFDAVHRQMLEYKREVEQLRQQKGQLEHLRTVDELKTGVVVRYLDQFIKEVILTANRMGMENVDDHREEHQAEACRLFNKWIDKEYLELFDEDVKHFMDQMHATLDHVLTGMIGLRHQERERLEWTKQQGN
jgi:hypothetical protein